MLSRTVRDIFPRDVVLQLRRPVLPVNPVLDDFHWIRILLDSLFFTAYRKDRAEEHILKRGVLAVRFF
ncbi:hypothetical protein RSA36_21875 [Pantoea stewartii]|uniref:Uncharacterized protein n=1 Tax=Pantoea stewartii TaxID=66269 RepID=A0AB34VFM7_9GAMM|nr:hypothetical protein RSA13_11005 [Pantoea stewartii]KTT04941.1 hypothetical protein RSA36_21875 [Pantoea stewartii]